MFTWCHSQSLVNIGVRPDDGGGIHVHVEMIIVVRFTAQIMASVMILVFGGIFALRNEVQLSKTRNAFTGCYPAVFCRNSPRYPSSFLFIIRSKKLFLTVHIMDQVYTVVQNYRRCLWFILLYWSGKTCYDRGVFCYWAGYRRWNAVYTVEGTFVTIPNLSKVWTSRCLVFNDGKEKKEQKERNGWKPSFGWGKS